MLTKVAQALATSDPDQAERIARSITDQPSKGEVLTKLAEALATTDPDRAERTALLIPYRSLKVRALVRIAEAYNRMIEALSGGPAA
jgi:hypothetical protein